MDSLEQLRMADFERTQLHRLRLESRALLLWTDPPQLLSIVRQVLTNWYLEALGRPGKKVTQVSPVIWYTHDHWYEIAWIAIQPWLFWAYQFLRGILRSIPRHPKAALRSVGTAWASWFYFFALGPALFVFLGLSNLVLWVFPNLVEPLQNLGTRLIVGASFEEDLDVLRSKAFTELAQETHIMPTYSHVLAEFLLTLSAIVYTRDYKMYQEASTRYAQIVAKDGQPLPSKPVLHRSAGEYLHINHLLENSEIPVKSWAQHLDMDFSVVSELDSGYGGPTATLFWAPGHKFLVLAIKGTNLFNINEWLIDTALQKVRVACADFPFAEGSDCHVHQGFYNSLFPSHTYDDADHVRDSLTGIHPLHAIVESVKLQASQIRQSTPGNSKVNLWITGHSLGAAIASLLHARLVVSDLGENIRLMDTYTFGHPMTSDFNFVSRFAAQIDLIEHGRQIWRVINEDDAVTRLPPTFNGVNANGGVADLSDVKPIARGSILDYSSVGYGVKYSTDGSSSPEGLETVKHTCDIGPIVGNTRDWIAQLAECKYNPIRVFFQHSPISYLHSLRQSRGAL